MISLYCVIITCYSVTVDITVKQPRLINTPMSCFKTENCNLPSLDHWLGLTGEHEQH